ncbi:MAG: hypothetical protein ACXVB9_01630 [Bdellovibrionota bacterium]
MRSILTGLVLATLSVSAFADDLDVTCHTLGSVGQCQSVTFCTARTEGRCVPKAADRGNPQWIKACAASGPDEHWCGYQAFCEWNAVTTCEVAGR